MWPFSVIRRLKYELAGLRLERDYLRSELRQRDDEITVVKRQNETMSRALRLAARAHILRTCPPTGTPTKKLRSRLADLEGDLDNDIDRLRDIGLLRIGNPMEREQ